MRATEVNRLLPIIVDDQLSTRGETESSCCPDLAPDVLDRLILDAQLHEPDAACQESRGPVRAIDNGVEAVKHVWANPRRRGDLRRRWLGHITRQNRIGTIAETPGFDAKREGAGHRDRIAGFGDGGIQQDRVITKFHGRGGMSRRSDASIDDELASMGNSFVTPGARKHC